MSREKNGGRIDTVIGSEAVMRGDLRVNGGVRFDGKLEGRMDVADVFLAGPRSFLKGEVQCRSAVIAGRIEGDIRAQELVELQTGAQVFGNVICRELVIQPGCFFEGKCTMLKEENRAEQ
ncbi:MAG: polymer-forming cytoskeletal protein [candidate division WOR-3 bacterium]|uniref:Polymer-forming cytoskeletal protein n=1 Tax=candidate division WOR-3 bacterium TaxID=2052148 RepID=A0A7C1SE44_UNCW3|nr:polymer-forming cytoskeletal protein [candidate division WOR-3 bacterium]